MARSYLRLSFRLGRSLPVFGQAGTSDDVPDPAAPTLDYQTPTPPTTRRSVSAWLSLAAAGGFFLFLLIGTSLGIDAAILMAVICGFAALPLGVAGIFDASRPNRRGSVAAVIGTVFGVLFVLGILFLPPMQRRNPPSKRQLCALNLMQVGQALRQYAIDNDRGQFPPDLVALYANTDIQPEVFICPNTTLAPAMRGQPLVFGKTLSFVYIGNGLTDSAANNVVLAYEPITNHGNGSNFLFADGRVRFLPRRQARAMVAQLEAGTNPPNPNASPPAE